jgi:hypothetical protein
MIGLAETYLHFLPEPEERDTQQGNCHEEKSGDAVHMLQPEGSAAKTHEKKQRRAHATGKRKTSCAVEDVEPPPQALYVRLEPRLLRYGYYQKIGTTMGKAMECGKATVGSGHPIAAERSM